jgi:hypothetical protein
VFLKCCDHLVIFIVAVVIALHLALVIFVHEVAGQDQRVLLVTLNYRHVECCILLKASPISHQLIHQLHL